MIPRTLLILAIGLFCASMSVAGDETTAKPASPTTTATTTTTTTTTHAPTTTAVPSTTKEPEPTPPKFPYNTGSWNVTKKDVNNTCIMLNAAIQISINYTQTTPNQTAIGFVDIPTDAKASGHCGSLQSLTLTWAEDNTVTFTFDSEKSNTTGNFSIQNIKMKIKKDSHVFINATEPNKPFEYAMGPNITGFGDIPLNKSLKCRSETQVKGVDKPFYLKMENVQFEAFRGPTNDTKFSEEIECTGDRTDVPTFIAGVVVAVLIGILVLLGVGFAVFHFVIKPRRAGGAGYQNM